MVLTWAEPRMPYHCVAYGCGKTIEDGVTLFKFPKDPEEFRKWEKQVQRTRSQWVATPNCYLCSEHFGKEYFEPKPTTGALKLRPGAAPTVFVRPHCSSCSGMGCSKCLPAIQRRGIAAEPREHAVSVKDRMGASIINQKKIKSWLLCLQSDNFHPVTTFWTVLPVQNIKWRSNFKLLHFSVSSVNMFFWFGVLT